MREDDDSESGGTLLVFAGVLAGVVAGVVVAQRVGGWRGVQRLLKKRRRTILSVIRASLPPGALPAILEATGVLDLLIPREPLPRARRRPRRPSRPSRDLDEIEVEEYERAAAGLAPDDEDLDDEPDDEPMDGSDHDDATADESDDSPELLEARVLEAFLEDPILRARAIEISADDDGWVELSGRVRERSEARLARDVARDVEGVRGVTGVLTVRKVRGRVGSDPVVPEA